MNTGCIPANALVASARGAYQERCTDLGSSASRVQADMRAIKARKHRILKASRDGVERSLRDTRDARFSENLPVSDPPLGQVGMTETEARASGKNVLVAKRPMSKVNRAVEKGETQGFLKAYVDADTKRILGATFFGTGCDEVIHSVLYMMYAHAPYTAITQAMPIHPTVSELLPSLFNALEP